MLDASSRSPYIHLAQLAPETRYPHRRRYFMQPRTQRQREILDYITRFIERHGYEPSYAQIARHFGVSSKATIAKHIAALEKRGLISRHHEDGAFGIEINVESSMSNALCEVPLLGRIAAGEPIDAVADGEPISVP